ncbi:unnamed protein product [Cunninghamella blakesleeana]
MHENQHVLFNEDENRAQHTKKKVKIDNDYNPLQNNAHDQNYHRHGRDESLWEENRQLRAHILQLEEATTMAENRFMEISAMENSPVEKKRNEYEAHAVKEFEAYDEAVQKLNTTVMQREKEVLKLKEQLEQAHKEIEKRITVTKDDIVTMPQNEDVLNYKQEYHRLEDKLKDLHDEFDTAQADYQFLLTTHPKKKTVDELCNTNLIQNLEDKVNFYKILTGLEVLNQELTKNGDTVTCKQHGRLGSITFKLITYNDDVNRISYQPLMGENDLKILSNLPDYFSEEIDFKKHDSDLFIWRLLTHLNKKRP